MKLLFRIIVAIAWIFLFIFKCGKIYLIEFTILIMWFLTAVYSVACS